MSDRQTLLGALWDRQAAGAGSPDTFVHAELATTPGPVPPPPARPQPKPDSPPETSVRGEATAGNRISEVRGEAPAPPSPPRPPLEPVTKVRREAATADTRASWTGMRR